MKPTLLNLEPVNVVEKILAGFAPREILTSEVVRLVDRETGEPLIDEATGQPSKIETLWTAAYAREAFVTVVEAFVLSEEIQLVCPIRDGAAIVPEYSQLVLAAPALTAVVHDPARDSGALDLAFEEWLDDGRNGSSVMFARAYNGQYGDVALRMGPTELSLFQKRLDRYNAEIGSEERFDAAGVLSSSLIFEAYDRLCREYRVRVSSVFQNQSALLLPPLASTLLERLPQPWTAEGFIERLLELRHELVPVRRKFSELQEMADDPGKSIAEAEKIMSAIEADARALAQRWNQNVTDHTLIQFCIDNLSFLVKLITKTREVDPAELAEKLAALSPKLERRLRSSAPTILSAYAMKTRRIADITRLFEHKLGVLLEDAQT